MSLTKYQASVLSAIRDEHAATRRPVRTSMVCVAMNAKGADKQEQVMLALTALKKTGHLTTWDCGNGWVPVKENRPIEYSAREERLTDNEALAVPAELWERCAAMHLSLMASAKEAFERGEAGAAVELRWLAETGRMIEKAGIAHG